MNGAESDDRDIVPANIRLSGDFEDWALVRMELPDESPFRFHIRLNDDFRSKLAVRIGLQHDLCIAGHVLHDAGCEQSIIVGMDGEYPEGAGVAKIRFQIVGLLHGFAAKLYAHSVPAFREDGDAIRSCSRQCEAQPNPFHYFLLVGDGLAVVVPRFEDEREGFFAGRDGGHLCRNRTFS